MTTKKPIYSTMTFCDIYPAIEEFLKDYNEIKFPKDLTQESINTVYYLLYANYGNSPIIYNDVEQFRYKLFALIWEFGPTWQKRVELQKKLRELSDDELMKGSRNILNMASNPASEPTEASLDELPYINQQQSTNLKRSKIDAYANLYEILRVDVTESFIKVFRVLFKKFVMEEHPILYSDEDCDDSSLEEVDIYGTSY